MKKVLIVASVALFAACNSKKTDKDEPVKTGGEPAGQVIKSPYEVLYSSSFTMGDSKNAETILTLWKDWDGGDLSVHKDMFADSVEFYFSDGSMMHSSRDSVIANAQAYRNTFASSVSQVHAVMAVKSADKNENWALIWGMDKNTDKNGKVDSTNLQETWRFNKDGKVNLLYQFRAKIPAPNK